MTDLVFARGSESPIYLYRTLNYSGQKKVQGFLDSCAEHGLDISQKMHFRTGRLAQSMFYLRTTRCRRQFLLTVSLLQMTNLATGAVKYALKNATFEFPRISGDRIQQFRTRRLQYTRDHNHRQPGRIYVRHCRVTDDAGISERNSAFQNNVFRKYCKKADNKMMAGA